MGKSKPRWRALREQARSATLFHEGQNYAMQWPWSTSSTNVTPHWEVDATAIGWESSIVNARTQAHGFACWFRILDPSAVSNIGIWAVFEPSIPTISCTLVDSTTIQWDWVDQTTDFMTSTRQSETFSGGGKRFDDQKWHFVAWYRISASQMVLIVDEYKKIITSVHDESAMGGGSSLKLVVGKSRMDNTATICYAAKVEIADCQFYATSNTNSLSGLDNYFQGFPCNDNAVRTAGLTASQYRTASWMRDTYVAPSNAVTWLSAQAPIKDLKWMGAPNLQSSLTSSWPRDNLRGNLYEFGQEFASWQTRPGLHAIGENIDSRQIILVPGWIWISMTDSVPGMVPKVNASGTALNIPSSHQHITNDNASFSRTTNTLLRKFVQRG